MKRRKIHILYEQMADLRPGVTSHIRLWRPLTHPNLRRHYDVTWGAEYEGQAVDAVIVDRLWRSDFSLNLVRNLLAAIQQSGAQLICAIDDELFEVLLKVGGDSVHKITALEFLLRQSHSLLVSTPVLKKRFASFNPVIEILSNALDERLLFNRSLPAEISPFGARPIVIGYMGTLTHDEDLLMILPALQAVYQRHQGEIEFQFIGVMRQEETSRALAELPLRMISPKPGETEYPHFMMWFCNYARWDIALAPLKDSSFNQCKSDIKFLDYSAIGAAGIYSRLPVYEASVCHLQTGWLAENKTEAWVTALETLLSDVDLRKKLSHNASRYLYTERILAHCAQNWANALESLLNGR